MSAKRLLLVFVLFLVALSTPVVDAQVSPRSPSIPLNDNFAGATQIVIGKDYKVKHIGAATNEASEPTAGCFSDNVLPHSVWFTFTLATPAQIYMSTEGSQFHVPNFGSIDTVMAVYLGDSFSTLSQIACGDGNTTPFGQVNFYADLGTYYVVVGTDINAYWDPNSLLKLNTRVIFTEPILNNSSFESALGSDNWKVKHPSGDDILCNNVTYPAFDGNCAFQFNGSPGESSKLTQTVPFPSGLAPRKNSVVLLQCPMRVADTPSLGNAKLKLTILYSDGTPQTSQSVTVQGQFPTSYYMGFTTIAYLASSKVDGFKIQVSFKSTSGVLMVDACGILYYATPSTRLAGPLRPPASAN